MSETTKFMKWDGLCFADATQATNQAQWRNQDSLGKVPPTPVQAQGSASPASAQGSGPTLSAQQAEVVLVSISEVFAPIEEHAIFELKFKQIDGIGCLVLQIHDADNQLVYAERLTKQMVLKLPDAKAELESLPTRLARQTLDSDKRKERREAKWASPVGGPYTVSLWVTDKACTDSTKADELALDVASESRSGSNFVEKHKPMNPGGVVPSTPPLLSFEQTSVRLTGQVRPVLMTWEELFEYVTGKEFPSDKRGIDALSEDEKVLWAKSRLNQLGFSAGPVDTNKTDKDYLKAAKRYGAMRAVGGEVHYKLSGSNVENVEKPFAELTTSKFDQLLIHLDKERELAKSIKPLSDPAKLGDGEADPLRIYIDGNHYYVTSSDVRAKVEPEWLTRPCLPIRPRVEVLGRDGRTPFEVPEVLEPLFFQWTWKSFDEDLSRQLDPVTPGQTEAADFVHDTSEVQKIYSQPAYRNKTRIYIDTTQKRVRAKAASGSDTTYANARVAVGGIVAADAKQNLQAVFLACVKDPTVASHQFAARSSSGLEHYLLEKEKIKDKTSPASNGAVCSPGGRMYFYPSLVAGDTYQLNVELFWLQQRTANVADIGADANRVAKLEKLNVPASGTRFQAQTRKLEAWRRLRVARYVHWPAQTQTWNKKSFELDRVWQSVKKEYAYAYIEFQDAALPVCTVADLALKPSHYENGSDTKLKNGVTPAYKSVPEAITKLLEKSKEFTKGRAQVAATPNAPIQFTPDYVIPPIEVKKLSIASGTLPKVTDVIDLVFLPTLNLYQKIRNNTLAGDELKRFETVWLLLNEWRQTNRDGGDLANAVYLAGEGLIRTLEQVVKYTAAPGGGSFEWAKEGGQPVEPRRCENFDDAGKVEYIASLLPEINVDYSHEKFPALMDLMFLPDVSTGIRSEIANWVRGTSLTASRTLGLKTFIKDIHPPLWDSGITDCKAGPHYFTGWALKRYDAYFEYILDKDAGTDAFKNTFKDLPEEQRNLFLCMTYPDVVENTVHSFYATQAMNAITDTWSPYLDQIVRKAILCETDGGGQYKSFADGMIILNALVYKPVTIEGKEFEVSGPSLGLGLGVVFVSHRSTMEPYALLAHEIGHVLYMNHNRNASTVAGSGFLFDHDHDDINCIMGYPLVEVPKLANIPPTGGNTYEVNRLTNFIYLHITNWKEIVDDLTATADWGGKRNLAYFMGNFTSNAPAGIFRPHYCGKCNLKLRGWNIYATVADANRPATTATANPVAARPAANPVTTGAPQDFAAGLAGIRLRKAQPNQPATQPAATRPAAAAAAEIDWTDPVNAAHPDLLPVSSRLPLHKMELVNRQFPGELVYGDAFEEFTFEDGDTLCGIAAAQGHRSCYPIISHPKNNHLQAARIVPGTTKVFVPKLNAEQARGAKLRLSVHFIRGASTAEGDLSRLNITNFHPTKAGPNGTGNFPDKSVRIHNADAFADPDAFQVEVAWSAGAPTTPQKGLRLSALKPMYDDSGARTGAKDFPKSDQAARSLELEVSPYPTNPNGALRLRSCYARLISLNEVKKERPDQTLLIGHDPGDSKADPQDQDVRAVFPFSSCRRPEEERCKVEKTIEVQRALKQVNVAIRVLRLRPNGKVGLPDSADDNGFVKLGQIRGMFETIVRNIFAQAHLRFNIVRLETVDPPSDLIAVGNENAAPTSGPCTIQFNLKLNGFTPPSEATHAVTVNVGANRTPIETARLIADAVNGLAIANLQAAASENPPLAGTNQCGADIVFTCPLGYRASIQNLRGADAAQELQAAIFPHNPRDPRLAAPGADPVELKPGAIFIDNRPTHFHIGTPEMRMIFKGLDTDPANIDLVCTYELYNARLFNNADGFALGAFAAFGAGYQPGDKLKNSVLMSFNSIKSAMPECLFLPHELGHVLIDTGMHVIGEFPAEDKTLSYNLMWCAPGDNKTSPFPHYLLNEGTPANENWTVFGHDHNGPWKWQGGPPDAPVSPGRVRFDAVARIHAHPCVRNI